MNTLKYLGLNSEKVAPVVKALSQLLADYQVFYANLRGFHWNVRGKVLIMLVKHKESFSSYIPMETSKVCIKHLIVC